MSSEAPEVLLEVEGHCALITLNRPLARNAISRRLEQELYETFELVDEDPSVWVAILAANGDVFCAGADLRERSEEVRRGYVPPPLARETIVSRKRVKPLIAAVDGRALGGGFELVLACDFVVASDAASFALPEVKWGQIASGGGLFRLQRWLPRPIALEMALTGSILDVGRAYELGLVNVVCPTGGAVAAAREFAGRILLNAPLAVQTSREVMDLTLGASDEECWRVTREAGARVRCTKDAQEGAHAFNDKRSPLWQAH